jgi:outer membrane receptor protein involved in Fe transport
MGGSAFRAPSIYELYYTDGATQRAPPREGEDALRPEKIWTTELELTQLITDELAVTASGYFNQVQRFIELQTVDARLQFRNSPEDLQSLGLEVELRREWAQGWMAAVSYSVQRTRVGELFGPDISGSNLVPNSPEHLLGVRGAAPLVRDRLTLAGRLRVESRRLDRAPDGSLQPQPEVPVVADLTLSGSFPEIGLRYALGVRNLLDWRFSLPAGEDIRVPFVPQVGRTFFLSTTLELR